MNFLEMCKRLRIEAGVSGTGPATVVGQTGEYERLVTWVQAANTEIQNRHNTWTFMWERFEIPTSVIGPDTYCRDYSFDNTDVKWFDPRSITLYPETAGEATEHRLIYIPYDQWVHSRYHQGTPGTGTPTRFTILPDKSLRLSPTPDAVYRVQGDYYREAQKLTANSHVSYLPEDHHMAAVYRALQSYGMYESAPEIVEYATARFAEEMGVLERDYLAPLKIALRALA